MNAAPFPAGFTVLSGRRLVAVTGGDRLGYLHRMLTQDIQGLAPGQGAPACYLSVTGRILAHMLVWNLGERLLLDVGPGASPEALPALERYVIADDVLFEDQSSGWARVLVVGDGSDAALRGLGGSAPALGAIERSTLAGQALWVLGAAFGKRPAMHLLMEAAAAPAVLAALSSVCASWSAADLDAARVAEGVAWAGAELDDRILPNEALLDEAVSFTKGCYPGQEPVIMARHRGHPSTLLVRLALEVSAPPGAGTALLDGARTVGRLTTVAHAPGLPPVALGFVRHALARAGQRLTLVGGGSAQVL